MDDRTFAHLAADQRILRPLEVGGAPARLAGKK
jgi:hypothetical protein